MDRQARRFQNQREDGSDGGSDGSSGNEMETAAPNESEENGSTADRSVSRCENCTATLNGPPNVAGKSNLCRSCYAFYRRTGTMKNVNSGRKNDSPGSTRHNPMKSKRKPPRGMSINLQDLMLMVNGPLGQGEAFLGALNAKIISKTDA